MSTFNGMLRLIIAVAIAGAAIAASAERARACSCLPPTVESSYNNSSDVVRARILSKQVSGTTTRYIARVQRTFKGCLAANQLVVLRTPTSSATCGVSLPVGGDYLINGDAAGSYLGMPQISIILCDYDRPFASLTAHDREFLGGRMVCCGARCACADGSQPVNCFVDPCQVAPECPEGECVANYCGGCNAEFYDERGNAVCEACQSDKDCAEGETCASDGACRPTQAECANDKDCMVTGCSGQVCAPEPVITTCEWRPEYACYRDPAITSCGCQAGTCGWDPTPELKVCLANAGPIALAR